MDFWIAPARALGRQGRPAHVWNAREEDHGETHPYRRVNPSPPCPSFGDSAAGTWRPCEFTAPAERGAKIERRIWLGFGLWNPWPSLVVPWPPIGFPVASLWPPFGVPLALFGAPLAPLGVPFAPFVAPLAVFGAPMAPFGGPLVPFGVPLPSLGDALAPLGLTLASRWALFVSLGTSFGNSCRLCASWYLKQG